MDNAKIIAVDFDGTLVENKWPEIGAPIEKNIAKVKAEQEAGAKIILWTNRIGEPLEKALAFCEAQGIHLDAVNENLPEITKAFGTDCRKIFANEYWDDRAVLMSEKDIGEFSDGFHTFNSLYHQRLILFAALVNTFPTLAWKSHKHSDGEAPFGGGWFIVGVDTPKGPYTYHYEDKDWDLFHCKEVATAPEWDGHTDNDLKLMNTLRNAGTDHRKFMRMITVYLDITAPLYWWKEFDTYKVGTVANSCSTMHKIAAKEFTLEDFSHEHLGYQSIRVLKDTIKVMNDFREEFIKDHEKVNWWQMIQLLPSSYNQKRTVMLNYEVLANIYKSRRHHKLDEWHTLCDRIESLPYSALITGTAV